MIIEESNEDFETASEDRGIEYKASKSKEDDLLQQAMESAVWGADFFGVMNVQSILILWKVAKLDGQLSVSQNRRWCGIFALNVVFLSLYLLAYAMIAIEMM